MFFVVRSNDSLNFPLGLIKYIVIVIVIPNKERLSGLVKHRDYPPHSYIVNERYSITRETQGQAKRKNSQWQEPVTSQTPNPNPGWPQNR